MGGHPSGYWTMIIGLWDDRKTGGYEEIGVMKGILYNFFNTPSNCNQYQFNVTLDITYNNTTLLAQGMPTNAIENIRDIGTNKDKEFRAEVNLVIKT